MNKLLPLRAQRYAKERQKKEFIIDWFSLRTFASFAVKKGFEYV